MHRKCGGRRMDVRWTIEIGSISISVCAPRLTARVPTEITRSHRLAQRRPLSVVKTLVSGVRHHRTALNFPPRSTQWLIRIMCIAKQSERDVFHNSELFERNTNERIILVQTTTCSTPDIHTSGQLNLLPVSSYGTRVTSGVSASVAESPDHRWYDAYLLARYGRFSGRPVHHPTLLPTGFASLRCRRRKER